MVTPTSSGWRFFRAGSFALVATQLAALGHLLGGGAAPDLSIQLTVTVFVGGCTAALADRRRSGRWIFAAMIVTQLLCHATFALSTHAHETSALLPTDRMLLGHLLAAAMTSALLAHGESMLFRLFAALYRAVLPQRFRPVVWLPPGWTALVDAGAGGLRPRDAIGSTATRRGPPVTA